MAYEGSVELISGIKTKNNGTFPLVDASDVRIDDDTRLNDFVQSISDQSNLKAPKASPEFTGSISLGRKSGSTVGTNSLAVGEDVIASGANSQAEGESLPGIGAVPTAYTTASGQGSHAEGGGTTASGLYSHAEGERSSATAEASHAEGQSHATGILSHAEGASTASGLNAHAEGSNTEAGGSFSHAENWGNFAIGDCSHAEGRGTLVKRYAQHAFGTYNVADEVGEDNTKKGKYIEIVGNGEDVNAKSNARALDWDGNEYLQGDLYIGCEPDGTGGTKLGDTLDLKAQKASPEFTGSISLGRKENTTIGDKSFAVGNNVEASGYVAHAEGESTKSTEYASHAEGTSTKATGSNAHAEGLSTEAYGASSHAEGLSTKANGANSHVQGENTIAHGSNTHIIGICNVEDNQYPEWTSNTEYHVGDKVSNNNQGYKCKNDHTSTSYIETFRWEKLSGTSNYAEIVGNGTKSGAAVVSRSNARALDWDGNEYLKGKLYINGANADATGGQEVAVKDNPVFTGTLTIGSTTITESQLQQLLALLN